MVGFAHEEVEEVRAFIPPVAEQFGVVGRDDEWRTIQDGGEFLDLLDAGFEKVRGVRIGSFGGGGASGSW